MLMTNSYRPGYQGKRTVRDLKASAERSHPGEIVAAKRVANNTLHLSLSNGDEVTRLHDTDIVTRHPDGSITLNSGGWRSVTTKERIHGALPRPANPASNLPYDSPEYESALEEWRKGLWFLSSEKGLWTLTTPKGHFPFVDGMRVKADGTPLNKRSLEVAEDRADRDKLLIRYYLRKLKAKGWADPAGDPWIVPDARGLFPEDTVRDWLREGYVTQRLVYSALKWAGCGDVWIGIVLRGNGTNLQSHELNKVRRYLKRCLGLGA